LWREAIDLKDIAMLRSRRANVATPMEAVCSHYILCTRRERHDKKMIKI